MSRVVIQGDASGTGNFTIAAPNSNTDRTLTLPDEAGEVLINGTTSNVGIGTASPNNFYSLANNLVVGTGSSGNGMTIFSGSSDSGFIGFNDTESASMQGFIQYNHNGDYMAFAPNGSEKARITSTGTLAVNTVGSPYKIDVLDDTYVAYFHHSNGVGVFLTGGNNSWSAASDETLKENIIEINKDDSYNNIKNIRAVTYKYIVDSDETNRLGFIAQDWEPHYPEAITLNQDNKLGLNYTDTIPVLLSALQKAQEKIEALEARVTALENA